MDEETSFWFLMALLGLAALGTLGILACVAALCIRRHRQQALPWLLFGVGGGVISLLVISGLIARIGRVSTERVPPSVFVEWGAVAFPAGFAISGAVRAGTWLFFDREPPV
jgi:CHASE2 domain-containing sensor protein